MGWYVMLSAPRQEFAMARELEDRGAFTWTPVREIAKFQDMRDARRKWSKLSVKAIKTSKAILLPFIPGCVFTAFPGPPKWLYVKDTPKVIGVIANNHEPIAIRTQELANFREGLKMGQNRATEAKELKLGTKYRLNLKGALGPSYVELEAIPDSGPWVMVKGLFGLPTKVRREDLEEAA
jgi:transcription antitermination factor NusG